MDSALPSFARRQQLRDEYFSFRTDVDRKQFIKDTFLFGFQVRNCTSTSVCFSLTNCCFCALLKIFYSIGCADQDDDDVELKQFNFLETPVCWKSLKRLLGCSNNLLAAAKGTNQARATTHSFRPSRVGVSYNSSKHPDEALTLFNKREHVAMWLNEQKAFYCMQPDRLWLQLIFLCSFHDTHTSELPPQIVHGKWFSY